MHNSFTEIKYNIVKDLFNFISSLNPLQKHFIETNYDSLDESEKELFRKYITYFLNNGVSLERQAQAYTIIVQDIFKEQVYFKRHGKYRHSTYEQVASAVYQNASYMKNYMVGLALSGFLWNSHVDLHRFFIKSLDSKAIGKYLEIGPGHGFYFMQAMKNGNFDKCIGVDISPTSVEMTKNLVSDKTFGNFNNYEIINADFFKWHSKDEYDFIVMAEVLEHVENPQDFLCKISSLLSPSGTAYVTTCINAPAIDHIYLYETINDLTQQVEFAGMTVIDELIVPYTGKTIQQSLDLKLPINIAQVLQKS